MLAAEKSEMHAVVRVKAMVYEEAYRDWLEGGLRMAHRYRGRSQAEMGHAIRLALAEHGSLVEAYRVGAL